MKQHCMVCSELKKQINYLKFLFIPEHNHKFGIANSVILTVKEFQVNDKAENIKIIVLMSGSNTKDEQQLVLKNTMASDLRCHLLVLTS